MAADTVVDSPALPAGGVRAPRPPPRGGLRPAPARAQRRPIKIGYVSPQTGPLAGFGEADSFVVGGVRKAARQGPDDQRPPASGRDPRARQPVRSEPRGRGRLAADPVRQDRPHAGGEHAGDDQSGLRPVRGQRHPGRLLRVPVAAVVLRARRQAGRRLQVDLSLLLGPGGHHRRLHRHVELGARPTRWSGALWPNDGDGNAWGDKERGFPPALAKAGYKVVDPGRYPNLSDDFSAQIPTFKSEKVEIVTGVPIPPDWTTFWKQAAQQGFRPKVASVGKALLFPRSVEALGDLGDGMSTEVWWTPQHPFKSSLTGATAAAFAADVHARDEEAVDAAARLHPRPLRGRPRRAQAGARAWTTRPRSSPPSRPPTSTRSSGRSAGPRARCPTSPRRRWSAASGAAARTSAST